MFGISGEHLVVLVVILLIFGPKRLPQLGNTLGKAIKNFKDAVSGVEEAKFRKIDDESDRADFKTSERGTDRAEELAKNGEKTNETVAPKKPDQS